VEGEAAAIGPAPVGGATVEGEGEGEGANGNAADKFIASRDLHRG